MESVVACYVFSLVILCLAGLYWVRALRIERAARASMERMKINLNLSKGSRDARKRMWLRDLQQKGQKRWQGRDAYNRFSPSPVNAKKRPIEEIQREFRKRKEALLKAFGGRK